MTEPHLRFRRCRARTELFSSAVRDLLLRQNIEVLTKLIEIPVEIAPTFAKLAVSFVVPQLVVPL